MAVTLAACSDSDSSTEDSSAELTVTGESGATATFSTKEATVDEVFEFFYDLGGDEFTGTIHWGDNTTTRVRGSGKARHIYRSDGERSIAIQIDGGDTLQLATIRIVIPPESVDSQSDNSGGTISSVQLPTTITRQFPSSTACDPNISSPSTTLTISLAAYNKPDITFTFSNFVFIFNVTTQLKVSEGGTLFANRILNSACQNFQGTTPTGVQYALDFAAVPVQVTLTGL